MAARLRGSDTDYCVNCAVLSETKKIGICLQQMLQKMYCVGPSLKMASSS